MLAPEKRKQHFRSTKDLANIIEIPERAGESEDSAEDSWSQSFNIECSEIGLDKDRLADLPSHRNPNEKGGDDGNEEDEF